MDLDWITLYDYMTIHSQTKLTEKINKFYESFYPLKLKKKKRQRVSITEIERGGLLGIIGTYITRVLSVLTLYLEAENLLVKGKGKQQIKLSRMFIQIQTQNLATALRLQQTVYTIQEAYLFYLGKQHEKISLSKGFLQLKMSASLKRLFQFYYHLEDLKHYVDLQGYSKIYNLLRLYSYETLQIAKNHLKLYPQIKEILTQILKFFASDQKVSFNFHSHLIQETQKGAKKSFEKIVKQLFSIMPNKQKQLFLILSDQNFVDFLNKSGISIPITKQPIQNYFRSQQEINALIAEQQNFLQSILVSENYRGKPQWKRSVVEQLVNLSTQIRKSQTNLAVQSKKFKFSQDFPLFNN